MKKNAEFSWKQKSSPAMKITKKLATKLHEETRRKKSV